MIRPIAPIIDAIRCVPARETYPVAAAHVSHVAIKKKSTSDRLLVFAKTTTLDYFIDCAKYDMSCIQVMEDGSDCAASVARHVLIRYKKILLLHDYSLHGLLTASAVLRGMKDSEISRIFVVDIQQWADSVADLENTCLIKPRRTWPLSIRDSARLRKMYRRHGSVWKKAWGNKVASALKVGNELHMEAIASTGGHRPIFDAFLKQ